MHSKERCNISPQSCGAMIWQTSRTARQSWRCKGRPVSNLTVHARQSRLTNVCQSLTNAFKTFLCSSQSLHSCAILFGKMLRLIHSHQKFHHCFTWTLLEWKMRFWHYKQTFSWSPELMESSGTYSQRKSTPTWGNVLPPWLIYSAPLIYVSQPFPTWRSLSLITVPP